MLVTLRLVNLWWPWHLWTFLHDVTSHCGRSECVTHWTV